MALFWLSTFLPYRSAAVDWSEVTLLGVDVGFSSTKPTTGIAWMTPTEVKATKTHTDEARRLREMPGQFVADKIAIDGPLVPNRHSLPRAVESRFSKGLFQRRFKPGSSHFGKGLELRAAAHEAAITFRRFGQRADASQTCRVVEAFPNAFLSVMLSDDVYERMPPLKRGEKFDWLYDRAIELGRFNALLDRLQLERLELLDRCLGERDHERRAALVCVLTAACALAGVAKIVGDEDGGWFWMPPDELWQSWARDALGDA